MTLEELAMAAYVAYGDYVDWKDGDFDDVPAWHDLPEQERGAWMAAASRVVDQVKRDKEP
jgi:hypothetical protein